MANFGKVNEKKISQFLNIDEFDQINILHQLVFTVRYFIGSLKCTFTLEFIFLRTYSQKIMLNVHFYRVFQAFDSKPLFTG